MSNQKYFNTPVGVAIWPKLVDADEKFNKWGVKLALPVDDEATQDFIELIDKLAADALENTIKEKKAAGFTPAKLKKIVAADLPYEYEEDDDGEPTGRVLFNFSKKSIIQRKDKEDIICSPPGLFDAAGKKIPGKPQIWGGSKLIVNFGTRDYWVAKIGAGVSLQLRAVQVIELVSGGAATAEDCGFEAHEGGYVADQTVADEAPTPAADTADEDSDDEDF
jgi:hypothetical protein